MKPRGEQYHHFLIIRGHLPESYPLKGNRVGSICQITKSLTAWNQLLDLEAESCALVCVDVTHLVR